MIPVSIYSYYSFGYNYNLLLNAKEGILNNNLFDLLSKYLSFVDKLNLPVTKSALGMKGIYEKFKVLEKRNSKKTEKLLKVDPIFLKDLTTALKEIDTTLDAELNIKKAYLPSESRFSHEILMNGMGQLFSKGTFNRLPELAKFDFSESGKSLVFDLFTASAFHALRGTEELLKLYYIKVTGNSPKEKDTWAVFLDGIKQSINNGTSKIDCPQELLTNMDLLREYYRNKTQHPLLKYAADEAYDLLSSCIKAVNMMMKDINEIEMNELLESF